MANKQFHIGLASAGAISAGAYSAGVFDFLIFALDEWEKAKEEGDHQVVLPIFAGAIGILAASRTKTLSSQPKHKPDKHNLFYG